MPTSVNLGEPLRPAGQRIGPSAARRLAAGTSLVLLMTALVGASWVPTSAAANALLDPAHNFQFGRAFLNACMFTSDSVVVERRCEAAALPRFDVARRSEGLPPLTLPSQFPTLPYPQQLLVLINIERAARGLPPAYGISPTMSRLAVAGALVPEDPSGGISSVLSLGTRSTLIAVFGWLYDDGWGGSTRDTWNGDCKLASDIGCWGHRRALLVDVGQFLLIGAADVVTHGEGSVAVNVSVYQPSPYWSGFRTTIENYASATSGPVVAVASPYTVTEYKPAQATSPTVVADGPYIWVLNWKGPVPGQSSISEIDVPSGAVIRTITDPSMQGSTSLAVDGADVWVANSDGGPFSTGSITEIDKATGDVVRVITAASNNDQSVSSPYGIFSNGSRVWVLNLGNQLTEFAAASGALIYSKAVPALSMATAFAFNGSWLWLTEDASAGNTGSLIQVSLADGTYAVVATSPTFLDVVSMTALGGELWIDNTVKEQGACGAFQCDSPSGRLDEIDPLSGNVRQTLTGGYFDTPGQLSTDGSKLWMTSWGYGDGGTGPAVVGVDPSMGKVVNVIASPSANALPDTAVSVGGDLCVVYQLWWLPVTLSPNWFDLVRRLHINPAV